MAAPGATPPAYLCELMNVFALFTFTWPHTGWSGAGQDLGEMFDVYEAPQPSVAAFRGELVVSHISLALTQMRRNTLQFFSQTHARSLTLSLSLSIALSVPPTPPHIQTHTLTRKYTNT